MAQWENEIVQSALVKRHSARLLAFKDLVFSKKCALWCPVPDRHMQSKGDPFIIGGPMSGNKLP